MGWSRLSGPRPSRLQVTLARRLGLLCLGRRGHTRTRVPSSTPRRPLRPVVRTGPSSGRRAATRLARIASPTGARSASRQLRTPRDEACRAGPSWCARCGRCRGFHAVTDRPVDRPAEHVRVVVGQAEDEAGVDHHPVVRKSSDGPGVVPTRVLPLAVTDQVLRREAACGYLAVGRRGPRFVRGRTPPRMAMPPSPWPSADAREP